MSQHGEWTVVAKVGEYKNTGLWMWELVKYRTPDGPEAGKRISGGIENTEEQARKASERALVEMQVRDEESSLLSEGAAPINKRQGGRTRAVLPPSTRRLLLDKR